MIGPTFRQAPVAAQPNRGEDPLPESTPLFHLSHDATLVGNVMSSEQRAIRSVRRSADAMLARDWTPTRPASLKFSATTIAAPAFSHQAARRRTSSRSVFWLTSVWTGSIST